jgi:aminopeptidase N
MPTYLLAMFVTDYEHLEKMYQIGDRSIKLRFWGRPDQLPNLKQSMAVTSDLLNYLETYVRQPFTLPKIDFITAPMQLNFEAMENWGLILFRYIIKFTKKFLI